MAQCKKRELNRSSGSRVSAKHDLALQLPLAFSKLMFKYSAEFDVDCISIYLQRRAFSVELETKGQNVIVNVRAVLGRSERYLLHDMTNRLLAATDDSFPVHVEPTKMLKALEMVGTGSESVRIYAGEQSDSVLIEGGAMRLPSEVGRAPLSGSAPAAKKSRKSAAAGDAPGNTTATAVGAGVERVWDSVSDASVKCVQAHVKGQLLPDEPFDQIIVRFDALWLYTKMRTVMAAFGKDKVDVTLRFNGRECMRHPDTHAVVGEGDDEVEDSAAMDADGGEGESSPSRAWRREEQDFLGEAGAQTAKGAAANAAAAPAKVPYPSWVPESITWVFTSASTSSDATQRLTLTDRTQTYRREREAARKRAEREQRRMETLRAEDRPVDWESNSLDVNNPLAGVSEVSLGLFNASATVAELLAFPTHITHAPPDWKYSGRHLQLTLGGYVFSRKATLHANLDGDCAGALWMVYPFEGGQAGALNAVVGQLAQIGD